MNSVKKEIKGYGWCVDPSGLESPTQFRIMTTLPASHNFADEMSLAEREKILKDWQITIVPMEGKRRTYNYWPSISSLHGKDERLTVDEPVYGKREISFRA